jgi:hypothetical protein
MSVCAATPAGAHPSVAEHAASRSHRYDSRARPRALASSDGACSPVSTTCHVCLQFLHSQDRYDLPALITCSTRTCPL